MEFSRQEYWNGLTFPSPEDLPDPGIEPVSLALAGRFFTTCTTREAYICIYVYIYMSLYIGAIYIGSDDKESTCIAGDLGLIPGLEDPLEECLATYSSILAWRIPMERGASQATVYGITKSQTRLSDSAQHMCIYWGCGYNQRIEWRPVVVLARRAG